MTVASWFGLQARGTTVGRELQAGVTTFAAMAYILAVNPSVLAEAGMDRAALVTVTALSAVTVTRAARSMPVSASTPGLTARM
ncbi:MAG TPA: hypothetical protein VIY56_09700 [Vicinamibacterales bacterium]